MNRTFSRKEAAHKLGTTVAILKELEANGTVVPLRDEKKRPRYTLEMIEALRPLIASMAGPPMMPYEPPATPMAAPATDPYFGSPTPSPMLRAEAYVAPDPTPPPPRTSLTLEDQQAFGAELEYALAQEAARLGIMKVDLLQRWMASPSPGIPPTFEAMLAAWSPQVGMTVEEFWEVLLSYLPSAVAPTPMSQPYTPSPSYSAPSYYGYSPPPAAPPQQYFPPYSPPYAQYMPPPSAPARPKYTPPRAPGYYPSPSPWPGHPTPPFSMAPPQCNAVTDARNNLEIQRIEAERRRLERLAADEDEARQRAEEAEDARAIELERARALAVAQAQGERLQRDKMIELQRQAAEKQAAAQAEAAKQRAEEQRRQQQEIEEVERTIAQVVAQLPPYIPFEAAEAIRESIRAAVAGKPASVVAVIARDVAARAVAPYQMQQQLLAARQQIANSVTGYEKPLYMSLGAEAVAAAENAVRAFLESGAADGMDHSTATTEARRIRDGALAPYRQAAQVQEAARHAENAIVMKTYDARSRASELLRSAGVEDSSAVETAVARAIELTRSRATQLNPSMDRYTFGEQVGELLMAAVEEAIAER